jgi:MinD superfamily P-loop ATPase
MIIAIASGKGGTGKTTVAVNLAYAFDCEIQLLDCDVEEPNVQLFLKGAPLATEEVAIPVPQIDESLCDGCGECSRFCEYNAIVSFGTKPLVFADMCHGCGGCMKVCPRRAIREIDNRIGVIETFRAGKISLIQGRLDVGAAMAPPLFGLLKEK